jgi:hypothetical protein
MGWNHCRRRKAITITYSKCVCSLSYPACKAHPPHYIFICGLFSSIFCYSKSHNAQFLGKKNIEHNICVLIFSTTIVLNISLSKNNLAIYYHQCTLSLTKIKRLEILKFVKRQ